MHHEPGALEQVIHFLLFLAGAGVLGVVALAILEAHTSGARRLIRMRWIIAVSCLFVLLLAAERAYHAFT